MQIADDTIELFLGIVLLLSSLGLIFLKNPVHACLSFLVTLMTVAWFFLELAAEFISVIQILIYAGAILVIFIFALVLFQDAYQQIDLHKRSMNSIPTITAIGSIFIPLIYFYARVKTIDYTAVLPNELPHHFGTAEGVGKILYSHYFFPFEAVVLLFLIALIGSLYLAKKET